MGRHSTPGDDEVDDPAAAVEEATLDLAPRVRGRHSSPGDDSDEQPTQMIAVVDVDLEQAHDTAVTGELPVLDGPGGQPDAKVAAQQHKLVDKAAAEQQRALAKAAADERKAADRVAAAGKKTADEAAAAETKAAKQAARAAKKTARGETNTQADLRLLRTSSAVRAQCVGAVVVSFALYTLVMAVIGNLSDYALFVWIPIVVSGILIGIVLDLAHRRASRPAADLTPEPAAVEPESAAESAREHPEQ